MGLLDGKVAVVTGAGRGIGRAVALAFAAQGARLALAARSAPELEAAAAEIRAANGSAIVIPTDVTRQAEVDALFARTVTQFGRVDILVNNAADIGPTGMLWEVELAEWQAVFEANLFSIIRCCRAALPGMIARRSGKIIHVGSDAGSSESWAAEFPEQAAYGTTKAAVARFSQLLAQQVKRYGINVNCLGVSAHTRMGYAANVAIAGVRGNEPPAPYDTIPAEQRVLPEENTGAFLFLASPLSDHITGAYFEANYLPDLVHRISRDPKG